MPSHVTHWLFAEQVIGDLGVAEQMSLPDNVYLTLGAQGPDIFYHNQRRKPSGLSYGSLMHRHGYGTAVSWMWYWASEHELGLESWVAAWTIGFATHAILDRFAHPFINCFAGWVEAGNADTDRYRSMHPFLERLIDVELLGKLRGVHPRELDFFSRVDCGPEPSPEWLEMVSNALRRTYQEAARDDELPARLRSAYVDTRGYYGFTNSVDLRYLRKGLIREERGEVSSRWLSVVHPLEVPPQMDVLNTAHAQWCHPCDAEETRTDSFLDCYESARRAAVAALRLLVDRWDATPTEEHRRAVAACVGDWNLSDGRETTRPCTKKHARPLPLAELQDEIRSSIRAKVNRERNAD
jgi:hypothetical protein